MAANINVRASDILGLGRRSSEYDIFRTPFSTFESRIAFLVSKDDT
jgi:hypothetical protein